MDQKQLFTMCWISPSELCPKMKLDFQNIDWEFKSFGRQIFQTIFEKVEQNDDNLFTVWPLQSSQNATILLFCIHWAIWKPSSQLNGSNNEPIRPVVRGFGSWLAFLWMPFNYCATPIPQFYIQLLCYKPHLRTWILHFGPSGPKSLYRSCAERHLQ